jgi:hypothetical protein
MITSQVGGVEFNPKEIIQHLKSKCDEVNETSGRYSKAIKGKRASDYESLR